MEKVEECLSEFRGISGSWDIMSLKLSITKIIAELGVSSGAIVAIAD